MLNRPPVLKPPYVTLNISSLSKVDSLEVKSRVSLKLGFHENCVFFFLSKKKTSSGLMICVN
jgi:hypothetical protein